MKVQKPLFAGLLFLLLAASIAFGAPLPEAAAPAAPETTVDAAPADLFTVSVLNRTDCAATGGEGKAALSSGTCGACGPSACWNQAADTPCGVNKFCREVPGLTCIDQNSRCRCEA